MSAAPILASRSSHEATKSNPGSSRAPAAAMRPNAIPPAAPAPCMAMRPSGRPKWRHTRRAEIRASLPAVDRRQVEGLPQALLRACRTLAAPSGPTSGFSTSQAIRIGGKFEAGIAPPRLRTLSPALRGHDRVQARALRRPGNLIPRALSAPRPRSWVALPPTPSRMARAGSEAAGELSTRPGARGRVDAQGVALALGSTKGEPACRGHLTRPRPRRPSPAAEAEPREGRRGYPYRGTQSRRRP